MIRFRIGRTALVRGMCVSLALSCCFQAYGAVTHSAPVSSVQPSADQDEATDDWFAEIDDMIQEMVVPATPNSPILSNPAVKVETNTAPRKVQPKAPKEPSIVEVAPKRFIKPEPVKSKPTPIPIVETIPEPTAVPEVVEEIEVAETVTPASESVESVADVAEENENSVIQEILQSDYWLEDIFSEPAASESAPAEPIVEEAPAVVQETEPEPPAVAAVEEPAVEEAPASTEEQLLLLERELLHDLATTPEKETAVEVEPEPVVAEEATVETSTKGVSIIEAELAGDTQPEPVVAESAVAAEEEDTSIEDALLAELDEFAAEDEPVAEPETVENVEVAETVIAELISEEVAAEKEASEIDQVLEIAEQTPVEEPKLAQSERIEEIRAQLDQAIVSGDRAALMALTDELSQLVEGMPEETAKQAKAPKEVAKVVKPEPRPVAQTPAPQLADPERHMKRLAKGSTPEETTPMRKAGQRKQVASVKKPSKPKKPAPVLAEAPAKKFTKQQVVVMPPSANKRPLRERSKQQASLPKPAKKASPKIAKPVVKRVPQTVAVSAGSGMRTASPKVDASVFMRVVPTDESRVRSAPVPSEKPKAKNAAVVVPADPSSDWDAPVPMEW